MNLIYENKHTGLLATLVLLLLISPIIDNESSSTFLLPALFTLVLISCTMVVRRTRRQVFVVLSLTTPWIYLTWLHPRWSAFPVDDIANIFLAACTLYVAIVLLLGIVSSEKVSRDVIFGAIAVYLLIGICWTIIFALIEAYQPGSFNLEATEKEMVWNKLLYFSFSTITTLGYGDITPITSLARTWAVFEAMFGTFFLAVLISRLVAMYKK